MKPEFAGVLPAGTELFEYRIERVLGRPGGFGVTYLALDTHLQKQVAIKEYLPTEFALRDESGVVVVRSAYDQEPFDIGLRYFIEEAQTLARFESASVVRVLRFFKAQQTAYIVMEYVRGETLSALLLREGTLEQAPLQRLLLRLVDGLSQVHAQGVFHRDIKPDNIMIGAGGVPVLIDFGAARSAIGRKTRSLLSVLTPGYAPFEQYSENQIQGAWTDVYGLAAVAYRVVSGKKPPDAISRQTQDPMVPAVAVGRGRYAEDFLRAIDAGMAVDPRARPQDMAAWRALIVRSVRPAADQATAAMPVTAVVAARSPPTPVPAPPEADSTTPSTRHLKSESRLWASMFSIQELERRLAESKGSDKPPASSE